MRLPEPACSYRHHAGWGSWWERCPSIEASPPYSLNDYEPVCGRLGATLRIAVWGDSFGHSSGSVAKREDPGLGVTVSSSQRSPRGTVVARSVAEIPAGACDPCTWRLCRAVPERSIRRLQMSKRFRTSNPSPSSGLRPACGRTPRGTVQARPGGRRDRASRRSRGCIRPRVRSPPIPPRFMLVALRLLEDGLSIRWLVRPDSARWVIGLRHVSGVVGHA